MMKMLLRMIAVLVLVVTVACGDGGPDAPENLVAVAGTTTVTLSWDSVESDTETVKYNVYRGTTASGYLSGKTKVAASLADATYSDTSVTANTTYYYQVTAENSKGESGGSNEVKVTVGTIAAPTNLTGTAGIGQVKLSWDAVLEATGYHVYRGTTQSGSVSGKTRIGTNISLPSYTDATVTAGVAYYYQVTATDGSVESGGSNEVAVTP